MDPQACWEQIVKDLREVGDLTNDDAVAVARSSAIAGLRALADWLDRGGFPPEVE